MKRIVRLTESDLVRLVKRVIKEQTPPIVPEDVKKKIIGCTGMEALTLMMKYPKCLQTAIEFVGGEIDFLSVPKKIKECLSELENIDTKDINTITRTLNCLAKSSLGF